MFLSLCIFKHWTTDKVQKLNSSKAVIQIILTHILDGGRDSSVGIATGYGMEGPGI
jgi:hypothetical protein